LGRTIRSPRAHVPPSLAATCQQCPVSREAGRSIHIGSVAPLSDRFQRLGCTAALGRSATVGLSGRDRWGNGPNQLKQTLCRGACWNARISRDQPRRKKQMSLDAVVSLLKEKRSPKLVSPAPKTAGSRSGPDHERRKYRRGRRAGSAKARAFLRSATCWFEL
jgi:hypothetical protein